MRTVGRIEKPTTEKKEASTPKVEAPKTVEKAKETKATTSKTSSKSKKDSFNI